MKKAKGLVVCMLLFFCSTVFSQKKLDPKYENWYKSSRLETNEMIIEVEDVNAQANICKLKIKMTNKTNDYILYKPAETEFIYSFGSFHPKAGLELINGKNELLKPKETDSRILTIKGDTRFQVDSFDIKFNGFYRIPAKGKVENAPNFQLPASVNSFEAGAFKVLMTSVSQKTKETSIHFKVSYAKDAKHYAVVNLGKAVLKLQDGREFAMSNQKDKQELIADGDDEKIKYEFQIPASIVDMQFANMQLVWKDTFTESESAEVALDKMTLVIDPGMTQGKNK
ncbi:MAG: hypothetical protein QM737_02915 [Ferruginibacter sp.]